jgi:hypothetical protein
VPNLLYVLSAEQKRQSEVNAKEAMTKKMVAID